MLALLAGLALGAECPAEPSLRDPDGEITALSQNLKFIITGEKRRLRDALFAEWLRDEGAHVDLLLLSEARLTGGFAAWEPEWCFYTQLAGDDDAYTWAPISAGRPPGGLALGVRQREAGEARAVAAYAGRKYRAKPTSLAEGFLGRVFKFEKGWAGVSIEDTHLVWSHTQASYRKDPVKGAGKPGEGRAGQFADLADDLGRPDRATLLTGDLNLLDGFRPRHAETEARIAAARARDAETMAHFRERTGINLAWPWARPPAEGADAATTGASDAAVAVAPDVMGTFAGDIDRRRAADVWDVGAPYDRVGVNDAFLAQHPGTRVRPVEIARGWLGVSDHLGLEIAIPFGKRAAAAAPAARASAAEGGHRCGWEGVGALFARRPAAPPREDARLAGRAPGHLLGIAADY